MNPLDLAWMVGRQVEVSFHKPSMWFFGFGDSLGISVECPWRLLHRGRIKVSGEDHQQRFGLPVPIDAVAQGTSLLAGAAVQAIEVRNGTADLFIDFDSDVRLEIIPFSSGYESWQISGPGGKSVIAQGGGKIVGFV